MTQLCRAILPLFPSLERLNVMDDLGTPLHWKDDMGNTQWLELLDPFVAVKKLYLSREVALRVGRALQELERGSLVPRPQAQEGATYAPRLSRESQRWVLQKYSYGFEHITEEWLDSMTRVATLPKYQEAVKKMEEGGLRTTWFLPYLARQKDETLGLIRDRGFGMPTLLAWAYNDPTATIEQGHALFDLIARGTPDSRMYIFNRAGHFSYREHPAEFNEMLRGFIERIV